LTGGRRARIVVPPRFGWSGLQLESPTPRSLRARRPRATAPARRHSDRTASRVPHRARPPCPPGCARSQGLSAWSKSIDRTACEPSARPKCRHEVVALPLPPTSPRAIASWIRTASGSRSSPSRRPASRTRLCSVQSIVSGTPRRSMAADRPASLVPTREACRRHRPRSDPAILPRASRHRRGATHGRSDPRRRVTLVLTHLRSVAD
jgi:hypothetical protein